jgi:ABC-type multidrug transport system permease subunit
MTSPLLIRSFYFACFTTGLFTFLFLLMFVERPKQVIHISRQQPPSSTAESHRIRDKFAIYSCTTPSTTAAINDYAYYLVSCLIICINIFFLIYSFLNCIFILKPLTALAWQRLGFKSLVFITGTREKWTSIPVLSFILSHLEEVTDVKIYFIQSPHNHQAMISQNIR